MDDSVIKKDIQIEARVENLDELLDILRADMKKQGCPLDKQTVLEICAEEIFVNIASYAYGESIGYAFVHEEVSDGSISLCFCDQGKPYNPLAKEDPNIMLSAEERQIGGLGVYMVKNMMDRVFYEYKEGYNCLTMEMTW